MEAEKSLSEDPWLWGLVLVAAALGGAYLFWGTGSSAPDAGPPWLFSGVDRDSITALERVRGDTGPGGLRLRRGDGGWRLVRPPDVELDPTAVNRWLDTILSPRVIDRFPARPDQNYGFDGERGRIVVRQGEGRHVLYLGEDNALGSGFYVRYGTGRDAPVFLIASEERTHFAPTLDDVRRKELFDRPPDRITALELQTDTRRTRYARRSGGSWVARPDSVALTDTPARRLDEARRSLAALRAETFFDTGTPDAADTVVATLTLYWEDGDETGTRVRLGGVHEGKRVVVRPGWPPVTVRSDPAGMFTNLPALPEDWPRAATAGPTRGSPPSARPPAPQPPQSMGR